MKENIQRYGVVLGFSVPLMLGMGVLLAGPASAADPVMTEFDNLEGKVTLYAGAIVTLVVLSAAVFLGIKYLRKGVSNA